MAQGAELFSQTYNTLASEEASQRTHNLNVQKEQTTQQQKSLDDIVVNLEGIVSNAISSGRKLDDPAIQSTITQFENLLMQSAQNAAKSGLPIDPNSYASRIAKIRTMPSLVEKAEAEGSASGKGLTSKAGGIAETSTIPLEQAEIAVGARPRPDMPQTVVNVNTAEGIVEAGQKKATEKLAEGIGNRADQRLTQAFEGKRQNMQLDRVKLALSRGAGTGLGEETILDLRSLASTLIGAPVSEKMTEQELIRTVSNEMALRLRNPESGLGLTGNTSNKDLDFLKASVVGLGRTEQGNFIIIDMMQRFNALRIKAADEQQRIIDANNGVVPLDLDKKVMDFVNKQEFLTPTEKKEIELLVKSTSPAGSLSPEGQSAFEKYRKK